ncbi:MAG: hypothetical protein C0598_04980 [Marinilabiliales bacterium]|nr:MAG: hypothetical protein C0598_04980 [Marinilabiliales bacterium]
MTIKETYKYLGDLRNRSSNKYETKVYDSFINILLELDKRNFSDNEIQSIESELESLKLKSNPRYTKRYFRKAQGKFEKFLKESFSLTTKRYYTNMGVGLGSSFGLMFGIAVLSGFERSLGISLGLSLGMIIGLIIGRSLDAKAAKEGRVI